MCGDFLEELVNCKLIFLFPVFILEVMVPIMEALNLDKFNYKHTLGRERESRKVFKQGLVTEVMSGQRWNLRKFSQWENKLKKKKTRKHKT